MNNNESFDFESFYIENDLFKEWDPPIVQHDKGNIQPSDSSDPHSHDDRMLQDRCLNKNEDLFDIDLSGIDLNLLNEISPKDLYSAETTSDVNIRT